MRKVIFIGSLIAAFACVQKSVKAAPAKIIAPHLIISTASSGLDDKLQQEDVKIYFDEATQTVMLSYKTANGVKKKLKIGKYYNTFEEPPYIMETKKIDIGKYLIFIATNLIDLGQSRDNVYVFQFTQSTENIEKLCSFKNIAVYSQESGIDTLRGIKFYDYEIVRQAADGSQKPRFQLNEYKPYKYINEQKGKTHKFTVETRYCDIP